MQYLLQWQLTNPCLLPDFIIEADRRDSELEGTSFASMKLLSTVVNSLWAYSRSSRPSFVPNSYSPEELTSTTTARTFLGLDVLYQGQGLWPQHLSQYQLLEVLSWRAKPFFELVVSYQILHLLAQWWFDSSLHRGYKWLSVRNPHCLHCNFHK